MGASAGYAHLVDAGYPADAQVALAGSTVGSVAADPEGGTDPRAVVNAIQRHAAVLQKSLHEGFTLKSLHEGFTLTAAEAAQKVRPVVASAVGREPRSDRGRRTGPPPV